MLYTKRGQQNTLQAYLIHMRLSTPLLRLISHSVSLKHPFVNKGKKKAKNNRQTKNPQKTTQPKTPLLTTPYISAVILTILINLLNSKPKGAQVRRSVCQLMPSSCFNTISNQGRIP